MSFTVRTVAEDALEASKQQHKSRGEAPPVLLALAGGPIMIMPLRGTGLRDNEPAIVEMVRKFDVSALFFSCECWMSYWKIPKGYPDVSVLDQRAPRDDPNRFEGLRVVAVPKEGPILGKISVIKRTPFGSTFQDLEMIENSPILRDGTTEFLCRMLSRAT